MQATVIAEGTRLTAPLMTAAGMQMGARVPVTVTANADRETLPEHIRHWRSRRQFDGGTIWRGQLEDGRIVWGYARPNRVPDNWVLAEVGYASGL
jgi:hypothetical protein